MQEIKKSRILLASVLKPVDDTRMFEKFGVSLAKNYEVHIAGYPTANPIHHTYIQLHPHQVFKRISLKRVLIPFVIFRTLVRIRPKVFIISTHELLLVAAIARVFLGCKIIYDVQENYYRNIRYTHTFPPIIRALVALYVRLKERFLTVFIHHYLFAETGYLREIEYVKPEKITVLENKTSKQYVTIKTPASSRTHFVFSGTLAESTGIFIAIDIIEQFYKIDPRVRLTVIGYCAQQTTWTQLQSRIAVLPFITLIGGNRLVAHAEIMHHLQQADVGLITYPHNRSTAHSIPTKLYEYLALQLPILLIDHAEWKNKCAPFQAAVTFQPDQKNISGLWQQIQTFSFYTNPPEGVYWEDEEIKLLHVVQQLA